MFLHLLLLITITITQSSSPLKCKLNETLMVNVIKSLSDMGYNIEIGDFHIGCSAYSGKAANQGGAYGTYIRPKHNEAVLNLSYVYLMGAQSAVLFYGCTPPLSAYFSWRTQVYNNNPEWVWANMGNSINQLTINTMKRTSTSPFDDETIIITTGDNITYNDISSAFNNQGIDSNQINLDNIASSLIKMGTSTANDVSSLITVFRDSIPFNQTEFNYYCQNTTKPIYFISSGNETYQSNPREAIPIPILRNRTAEQYNELILNNSYNKLLNNIIEIMKHNYSYNFENKSIIYGEEFNGLHCIQNDSLCAGNSDDCLYFQDYNNYPFYIKDKNNQNILNPNIKGHLLNDNNLYILIGINHYLLNGSVYDEQTVYDQSFDALLTDLNQSAVLNNFQYVNSANAFNINSSISNIQYFFSIIISREESYCKGLEDQGVACLVIPYSSLPENIGFILFNRAYLNPQTKTGPSTDQLLPQYLMYFKK